MRVVEISDLSVDALTWIGVTTPTVAAVVSLTNIEAGLRIASLCVGLLVGISSFILIRKKSKLLDNERNKNID